MATGGLGRGPAEAGEGYADALAKTGAHPGHLVEVAVGVFLGYGIGRFSRRSLSGEGRQAFGGDGLIMALARKSVKVEDLQHLRLKALLHELVREKGNRGAAAAGEGVCYLSQTRAGHESSLINLTSLLPLMVWRKLSQIKQELP